MVPELRQVLPRLVSICRQHGVRRLWLFGSATGRTQKPFTASSDVDLLVEFDTLDMSARGLRHPLFTLAGPLEAVVGRRVQLTENLPFENPFFRESVLSTRELVYDAEHEKAALGHP